MARDPLGRRAIWQRPEWLNVVTVDIEDAHAGEFNRWYNEVHVPEILGCPGWIANRRYECVDGEPRFLAIYDLEDDERRSTAPSGRRRWGGTTMSARSAASTAFACTA